MNAENFWQIACAIDLFKQQASAYLVRFNIGRQYLVFAAAVFVQNEIVSTEILEHLRVLKGVFLRSCCCCCC